MMLLLMSMPCGWTQSLKKWVVVRSNSDTTVTYSFARDELRDLRVYIMRLEGTAALYQEDQKIITLQDSTIAALNKIILNKDYMLAVADSTVNQLSDGWKDVEAWGKKQEQLKLKYQKRAAYWPVWLSSGGILGVVLCLIFSK